MESRKHERHPFFSKAHWDFYTHKTGNKDGFVTNFSLGGCLLQTTEPIENRRWVRILLNDEHSNLSMSLIGRVVRCEFQLEPVQEGEEFTLYRYGIQFTHPTCLTQDQADLIFALSSRNLSVLSCLNRNKKSSLRPGFLA